MPMRRRLFTFASALSLLLFVVALGLWASALRWEMFVERTSMHAVGSGWRWRDWQLWSRDAGLFYRSDRWDVGNPRFADQWAQKPGHWYYKAQRLGTSGPPMGYPANLRPFWDSQVSGPLANWTKTRSRHYSAAYLPYWCVLLVTLPLPMIWFFRSRQMIRRRRENLCLTCGYSLMNNTSGVCPECGTRIHGTAGASS